MKRLIAITTMLVAVTAAASALEVTLPAAGTLKEYITPEQQETVTELKVNGDINGDDLRIIRHMIGAQVSSDNGRYAEVDSGACRVLDLSEANIIGEGFYTFKYVPKPKEGPAYYLPGMAVEANTITYAMFCGSRVETLILPNSVTYIGSTHRGTTADDRCIDGSHLRSVTLPAQLEHMAVYGIGLALRHRDEGPDYYEEVPQSNLLASPNLAEVKIADTNPHFKLIDGVLYSGDLTELMLCPPKREGSLEMPAATARIGYRACAATHITGDLTLPVVKFARESFYNATIDGNLNFDNATEVIQEAAFSNCHIAGDLTPTGKIEKDAFRNATVTGTLNLNNVTDSIKARAFYALKGNDFEITIPEKLRYIGDSAFCLASTTGVLIVPETLVTLCADAFSHNGFEDIQLNSTTQYHEPIDKWLSEAEKKDFKYDPFPYSMNITRVVIPERMHRIPKGFFSHCPNLKIVDLQNSANLIEIGLSAFSDCPSIEQIVIPAPKILPVELLGGAFYRLEYDRCHRKVFIPENINHKLRMAEHFFSPDDTLFVWLDKDKISEQIEFFYFYSSGPEIYYNPWANYGFGYTWVDDSTPYACGPTPDEKLGTGVLYVPKGCKEGLIAILESKIIYRWSKWGTPTNDAYWYPSFLYFKEIREFTDLGYPNYSLEDSAVEDISLDSDSGLEVAIFDSLGRRLQRRIRGINIIVYSDGSVKKEYVK